MARQLDRILVVDVECTCWEGEPRPGEVQEIVEIGVTPLEVATGLRGERDGLLVRPTRSRVSAFCTRLTTLTQEMVDGGESFADACGWLKRKHQAGVRTWASWGDFDRRCFERQCRELGVPYPFGPTHLNVKNLFALGLALPREVGVEEALALLGRGFEGTQHRGGDDAWNIAGVLGELLVRGRPPGADHASGAAIPRQARR